MIFLSSIPRSGSTLLTSLLNQRPDTYATPTSNLCDTIGAAVQCWEQNPTTKASNGNKQDILRIIKGITDSRYETKKTVFDKSRMVDHSNGGIGDGLTVNRSLPTQIGTLTTWITSTNSTWHSGGIKTP